MVAIDKQEVLKMLYAELDEACAVQTHNIVSEEMAFEALKAATRERLLYRLIARVKEMKG